MFKRLLRSGSAKNSFNITLESPIDNLAIDVSVNPQMLVRDVKIQASKKLSAAVDQLVLMYSGRILNDDDTLEQHEIKAGHKVNFIIMPYPDTTHQSDPNNFSYNSPFIETGFLDRMISGFSAIPPENITEMQQRLQQELLSNPQALHQIMNSPFAQNMSNPEVLQRILINNPLMLQFMERSPEITSMMNNPQTIQQTMELTRNPTMMQEMIRNQSTALDNSVSSPGIINTLQRMFTNFWKPPPDVSRNPFAALVNDNTIQTMFNTPAIQDLVQQITENPAMMQNMLSAPYMQSLMESISRNPDLAYALFSTNPLFTNNLQMQEMMPMILQQMQRPEMQNLLTDPRAMETFMQIQQRMQPMQRATTGANPSSHNPSGKTAQSSNVARQQLINEMTHALAAGGTALEEGPEKRLHSQLEQLAAMGFKNREANINALLSTNGNIKAAIKMLLR